MAGCILQKIKALLARGTLIMSDDKPKMRTIQSEFLKGDVREGLEHFEPYGWTSKAKAGAECLGLFFNGDRSHGVVVATADRRFRLHVEEGEVAIFDDLGQKVHLTRSGISIVTGLNVTAEVGGSLSADVAGSATLKAASVTIDAPQTTVTGNVLVQGKITGTGGMAISGGSGAAVTGSLAVTSGDVTADGISLKNHTHACPNGGDTGPAK